MTLGLNLSQFANQATMLTEEEVQQLIDAASGKPMSPGIHEVFVSAVPSDKIGLVDAPNDHLLKFNIRMENVAGESATVYCELPLQPDKMYKVDKEGNQSPRLLGRHLKTLTALGVPTGRIGELIRRVVETNADCLQGLKGFKAQLKITRNDTKCRLEYDAETTCFFITRNSDNQRMCSDPFALAGKGKERFAEAEVKCRELNLALETMPQTELVALVEVENDAGPLFGAGKVVNKVVGGVVSKPSAVRVTAPAAKAAPAVAKTIATKVAAKHAAVVQKTVEVSDDLPSDEDLDNADVAEEEA